MKRLTNEQLNAIRERAEGATVGPWNVGTDSYVCNAGFWCDDIIVIGVTSEVYELADAVFIAHARNDVPMLLAEIERLRDALEDIADTGELYHEHYCRDIAKGAIAHDRP